MKHHQINKTWVTVTLGVVLSFAALNLQAHHGDGPAPNAQSSLATNLHDFSYFKSSEWLVIDQFSKSSPWFPYSFSQGWNQGQITSSDANGWPTGVGPDTLLTSMMLNNLNGHYPAGTYVMHWEGDGGTIYVDSDASNLRCEDGESISNCPSRRALFDVTPSNDGIFMEIFIHDPGNYNQSNYIHNIRVIMPGGVCGRSPADLDLAQQCQSSRGGVGMCDAGETCYDFDQVGWNRFNDPVAEMNNGKVVFHPESVRMLEQFRALRYMNLMRTMESPVAEWSDRASVGQYSLGLANGMPPEYLVALANLIHADPWFNLPHMASTDYAQQLATLVKATLDSDLTPYIEYTNEHFNTDDEYPHQYMLDQANTRGIGVGRSDMDKRSMFYATRSDELFDAWDAVFNAEPNPQPERTRHILGAFVAYPHLTTLMLDMPGIAARVDAVAVAPYFGGYIGNWGTASVVENWNLDQLFNEIHNGGLTQDEAVNGALSEIYGFIDQQAAIIANYNLDMVAYEGGQHLWARGADENNQAVVDLLRAANHDARMEQPYNDLLNYWRNAGGAEFFHFNHMEPYIFGNFGSLEYQDSDPNASPKYRALQNFNSANPCWWSGC